MAADLVVYDLVHNHECSRKGERIAVRPICANGVETVTVMRCIEANVELEVADRRTY